MAYLREVDINIADSASDAFGRLSVAEPQTVFDAQFTYDLHPLLYEPIISHGASSTITHDSTNRRAKISFTATPTGNSCYLQTYEYFRYQPGKAQQIFMSFNFGAAVTNVIDFAQYGDLDNGFKFTRSGGLNYFVIVSTSSAGDQDAVQSTWNLDKLDGAGTSGITLDLTMTQILVIDLQALYVGRVRFGFDIDGKIIWCHEFLNANIQTYPYVQTANLPISIGMVSNGGTVTKDLYFSCCSVISNGGFDETIGYEFSTPDVAITSGSATRTHLVSIRPLTTFNSITNRTSVTFIEIDVIVTGNNPIYWELCLGQAFSVAPTYANISTTYSANEYGTGGTLSGSPAIVVDSGYVAATASSKGTQSMTLTARYPLTLNKAGAVRSLGTLTLLTTGLGGTSATRGVIKIKEIR